VVDHVAFLASDEGDGTIWLHTRHAQVRRPDISVHGVRDLDREATVDLVQRLVQSMAQGAVVPRTEIRMMSLPGD